MNVESKPFLARRVVGIEGLRGMAAGAVIVTHTYQLLPPASGPNWLGSVAYLGGHGLTLFFALSGFLLYWPFASAITHSRPFPILRRYFINRLVRIFPAYIAILLFVSLIAGVAYLRPPAMGAELVAGSQPIGFLTEPLLLIENLLMVQTLSPGGLTTGLSVSWSLTVEIVFYVVMPLFALGTYRSFLLVEAKGLRSRNRISAVVFASAPILLMATIGTLGKLWLARVSVPSSEAEATWLGWGGNWTAVLARSFIVHADLFASGMLAALALCLLSGRSVSPVQVRRWRWFGLLVGFVAVVVGWISGHREQGVSVLAGGLILFIVATATGGKLGSLPRLLDSRVLKHTGLISYSAYLWHVPVILLLHRFGWIFPATVVGWLANVLVVLLGTWLLSCITYKYVEKPALALKERGKDPVNLSVVASRE